jgi:hypothetical protein
MCGASVASGGFSDGSKDMQAASDETELIPASRA